MSPGRLGSSEGDPPQARQREIAGGARRPWREPRRSVGRRKRVGVSREGASGGRMNAEGSIVGTIAISCRFSGRGSRSGPSSELQISGLDRGQTEEGIRLWNPAMRRAAAKRTTGGTASHGLAGGLDHPSRRIRRGIAGPAGSVNGHHSSLFAGRLQERNRRKIRHIPEEADPAPDSVVAPAAGLWDQLLQNPEGRTLSDCRTSAGASSSRLAPDRQHGVEAEGPRSRPTTTP